MDIIWKSKWFFYEAILPELLGRYFSNRPIEQTSIEEDSLDRLCYNYCTCKKNVGGKMIMCTQEGCPNLWYHYKCLGIIRKPTKKQWKCPFCN